VIEIQQKSSSEQGKCRIYLSWFPYPNVRFEIEIKHPPRNRELMRQLWDDFQKNEKQEISQNVKPTSIEDLKKAKNVIGVGDAKLEFTNNAALNNLKIDIKRVGTHPHHTFENPRDEILGYIDDQQVGDGEDIKYLQFYLSNFYEMSLEIEMEAWRLSLTAVENIHSLMKVLEREGGYCISHIARLERLDDSCFSAVQAKNLLDSVFYGFSFMRGIRIAPILISGCNEMDEILYQELGFSWATPWEQECHFTCMAIPSQMDLNSFITSFSKTLQDSIWQNPLKSIIQWYIEAVRAAGGLEGSIVLLQTALETLAWVLIVDVQKTPVEIFDGEKKKLKTSAAEKINRLLKAINVSNKIPNSLAQLKSYSNGFEKERDRDDGPVALCRVRNSIAHASPDNRRKLYALDDSVIIETRRLALWYVELSILWILQYQGNYFNRVSDSNKLKVELVPWDFSTPSA